MDGTRHAWGIHYQYRSHPTHQKREQGQQCHHRVGALNNPGVCAPCLVSRKFGFVFVFVCGTVRSVVGTATHSTSATSPNSPRVPDGGNPARTDVRARTQSTALSAKAFANFCRFLIPRILAPLRGSNKLNCVPCVTTRINPTTGIGLTRQRIKGS